MWGRPPTNKASKKHVNPPALDVTRDVSASISSKWKLWQQELKHDPDRDFLMHGLINGFKICDPSLDPRPVETDNYASATNPLTRPLVEKQIKAEINNGNYMIVNEKPTVISALGAIPKAGNKDDIRLIHDCSQPSGGSVNEYAHLDFQVKYQSINDAAALIKPGDYCAKVDLKAAYRSVAISPKCYKFSGLKWKFEGDSHVTYMVDKKLMFGSKLAPGIFHRLSQAVKRMLKKRGIEACVVYLDDFLIIAPTEEACIRAMNILITLLRKLGFSISWSKVAGPSQSITFLGVNIDTIRMMLELPQDKLHETIALIDKFSSMKRASRKQLQSLAGKLNWASSVVRGGRTYLRRILDMIQPLRAQNHKSKLSNEFHADVFWWKHCLCHFHGKSIISNYTTTQVVTTDACTEGSGYFWNGDWGYTNWRADYPQSYDLHINEKEMFAALFAARQWAHLWSGSVVLFGTDNITTRSALHKKTSGNPRIMAALREMFALSVIFDFDFDAFHIPGIHNSLADSISRLHQPGQLQLFCTLLPLWHFSPYSVLPYADHMSFNAFNMVIFPQIPH